MSEYVSFGLTTAFVKNQFKIVMEKQGSLSKAIITLLNRDKYLSKKYRFQSLSSCEVWQEQLRPEVDSLSNLSSVLLMLDTYVKFNRLESRSAAIEELLQAVVPDEETDRVDVSEKFKQTELFEPWKSSQLATISNEVDKAQAQTDQVVFEAMPIRLSTVDSTTQTFNGKNQGLQNTACRAKVGFKEAGVQTEIFLFSNCTPPSKILGFQEKPMKCFGDFEIMKAGSAKYVRSAVEKPLSQSKSKKKSSSSSRETVKAKRSRKVPPSKAVQHLISTTSSSVAPAVPLPQMTVSNQVFSTAPLFSSLASSQHLPLVSTSSFQTLPANLYFYRGQQGIPVNMPHIQQPQLNNTKFVLTPRVVLSPLPVMNSPKVGMQSDVFKAGIDDNIPQSVLSSIYAAQVSTSPTFPEHSAQKPETEVENDSEPNKPIVKVFSTKTVFLSSSEKSNESNADVTCKQECAEEKSFPVSEEASFALKFRSEVKTINSRKDRNKNCSSDIHDLKRASCNIFDAFSNDPKEQFCSAVSQ